MKVNHLSYVQDYIGGYRIFLEGGGDFGNLSEASEHWGGVGLRKNEIWAFVS